MYRFIALRRINTMAGPVVPGDYVVGAEEWPWHIQQSEVDMGNVFDLNRQVRVNPNHSSGIKREAGLLMEMERDFGVALLQGEDGKMKVVRNAPRPPAAAPAVEEEKQKKGRKRA